MNSYDHDIRLIFTGYLLNLVMCGHLLRLLNELKFILVGCDSPEHLCLKTSLHIVTVIVSR